MAATVRCIAVAVMLGATLQFASSDARATSPCCAVADNGSSCKKGDLNTPGASGCYEIDDGTCISGASDPRLGGPAGCAYIGGNFILSTSNDPAQCTND